MNTVTQLSEWRAISATLNDKSIGFVPTMGHLHAGHLSLIKESVKQNDITIVSIFVNPAQFNEATDFENYPRTVEDDLEKMQGLSVDYVLMPDAKELYPDDYQLKVSEKGISDCGEGLYRPGHFDGMLTVIMKFFQIVQPACAYFGEKDYQQLLLVKKMVEAFFLPVQVIGCSTVREASGLAMSSRNSRLSEDGKIHAAEFARLLRVAVTPEEAMNSLTAAGLKVDYVIDKWQRRLAAVWLEGVRLIDNIELEA